MTRDLHRGFSDPRHFPADELVRFLEEADRLPDMHAVQKAMREAIDPRAGRRLPGLLTEHGLTDVAATPFPLTPSQPVWRQIVKDTVIAGSPDPAVADWLEQQEDAAARGEFVAAFTGVLTAATRLR